MNNIDYTTLNKVTYIDLQVDFIVESNNGETDYNNIVWRDKSILENVYFADMPYYSIPGQIVSRSKNSSNTKSLIHIPEYVSMNMIYSNQSSKGSLGNVYASISALAEDIKNDFALGTILMNCNDEAYCLFHAHWAGSSGCGSIRNNKDNFELNDKDKEIIYYDQWYRAGASYTIDGAFSSKIIHVPAEASIITIKLGKYGAGDPCTLEPWREIWKLYKFTSTGTTYTTYYNYVASASNWWFPCDMENRFDAEMKGKVNYSNVLELSKAIYDPLKNEKIVDSIDSINKYYETELTLNTSENTTNHTRWQFLIYNKSVDSKYQGYIPQIEEHDWEGVLSNVNRNGGTSKGLGSSKIILVQDIKDDPFIYYGGEIVDSSSYYGSSGYYYSVYRNIPNDDCTKSKNYWFDFTPLSFATLDNIKKYHKDYLCYLPDLTKATSLCKYMGTSPIVAIPEIYYNQGLRPTFYDMNGNIINVKDKYTKTNEPSNYTFNGINYKVFCPNVYSQLIDVYNKLGLKGHSLLGSNSDTSIYWAKTTLNVDVIKK